MIISHAVSFEFEGHTAVMRVLRNDGYCWGRIVTGTGEQLDVEYDADLYDWDDTDAAGAFIKHVQDKGRPAISPASREI